MMSDLDDDYCYVYLDFNEKLTPSIFANQMFLRVANLHKPNPLVQINDLVFKGSYDECVGTNLFFEEVGDPPLRTNIFEKDTPIRLKPIAAQTKIIRLKQARLPRQPREPRTFKESISLNLNQNYNMVLEKLEQDVLNIDDIACKEVEHPNQYLEAASFQSNQEASTEPEKDIQIALELSEHESPGSVLQAKYEKLKRLARRPVRRMKSPELVAQCEPQYREAFEYHNLERQVCQNSDGFRSVSCPILEKSFAGGVDVDRCVLQGLIPPSSDPMRPLTKEEQRKIFSISNFENLSLPARYLVLKECVAQIEELIESSSSEELRETDENGRTVQDICEIFRKLVRALEYTMGQSEGDCLSVKVRSSLNDCSEDDYVKYKHESATDVVLCPEIFNPDEWIDNEEKGEEEEVAAKDVIRDSADSMDDD